MNESTFSKIVCNIINKNGGHVSRVEAHASAAGIPDLNACYKGVETNIELKVNTPKKRPHTRDTQVRWFTNRTAAGGRPFFLCCDNGKDVILVEGMWAKQVGGRLPGQVWRDWADEIFPLDKLEEKLLNRLSKSHVL